jgi:hypothetical protein
MLVIRTSRWRIPLDGNGERLSSNANGAPGPSRFGKSSFREVSGLDAMSRAGTGGRGACKPSVERDTGSNHGFITFRH